MVYLNSLHIVDTGWLSTTSRGTQLSSASRANAGSALPLKAVDIDISATSNIDKSTPPGVYSAVQHALVSLNPTEFTLNIRINSKYASTSNPYAVNDAGLIPELLRLPKTTGWKAMYYPTDVASGTGAFGKEGQLLYAIGTTDTTESQGDLNITLNTGLHKDLTDVKYVAVRFDACRVHEDITNIVKVTLTGVFTV